MAFLKNTVSLLAVFCVIPAAFGATPRVGVLTNAVSRMPTLRAVGTATVTTTTPSTTNLMDNAECIDAYTECIKGDDVCGSDLSECTTNVLFHGKMPLCFSTLYQCQSSGISTLFGTASIDALSNVSTKNAAGEVTRYTYPTDGSVLGQLIIGANITNRYKDSATCVKKYKSCMYRDTVCGEDFELCTDSGSFKKQAPMCDSVLALCPSAGIDELFGSKDATARPSVGYGSGSVAQWVSDGADLAAANAVNTCYKVVDNCFLSACGTNPYRCVENTDLSVIETADIIGSGEDKGMTISSDVGKQSASDVKKFFKSACIDTIGTNKYCYMTFNDGKSPKKTDLTDPDSQEDLFSDAYTARKTYINSKLQTLVESFDTKAKKSCTNTIKSCAMRSCGGGSGAACYTQVFGNNGTKSVNNGDTYNEIEAACSAVVNTDPSCRYAAAVVGSDATYSYSYNDNGAFKALFGDGTSTTFADPIGAVAALNSSLATTYNAAGIAQLQKQCENVATNCVKSMCGTDYVNCYRSRNDIKGNIYNGGTTSFNNSMNKLGGVLDYNVVLGLCQNTVKNSPACEEHLSIVKADINKSVRATLWGGGSGEDGEWTGANTVADSWLGTTVEYSGNSIQSTDANGNKLCQCSDGGYDICETESNGVIGCANAYMVDVNTAVTDRASATLFQNLLGSIEKEAQGLYQSKLIKQRNMCEGENNGGIVGAGDMTSSTFMWAKLSGNGKVPADYSTQGLSSKQFQQTNDLYGGFCRIRVDVKSDDIYINELLGKSSITVTAFTDDNDKGKKTKTYSGLQDDNDKGKKTKTYSGLQDDTVRYFAAGDAFTCGGWISMDKLEAITNKVAENAVDTATLNKQKRTRGWLTALGTLGGGVGGFFGMDAIQKGKGDLGGLLSNSRFNSNKIEYAKTCLTNLGAASGAFDSYRSSVSSNPSESANLLNNAIRSAENARIAAQQAGVDVANIRFDGTQSTTTNGVTVGGGSLTPVGAYTSSQAIKTYKYDDIQMISWNTLINSLNTLQGACDANSDKNDCPGLKNNYNALTQLLAVTPTSAVDNSVLARNYAKTAIQHAKGMTNSSLQSLVATVNSLPSDQVIDTYVLKAVEGASGASETVYHFNIDQNAFVTNLNALRDECNKALSEQDDDRINRRTANLITGAAGAAALGVTTFFATRDIQESQNDKAKQEAIDEWMDNIGDKIKCYIGATEVGSYGDIVSTTLE